jgi:hypothetical protein
MLDEHISPDVAEGLRRHHKNKNIHFVSVAEWENGRFLGLADDLLLQAAIAQKLTLVTYDLRTIPPLIKAWAEAGHDHSGIIFVDERTMRPSDFGGLIHALQTLYQEADKGDWLNRVCFLRR